MVKRNRVLCIITLLAVIIFTASCLGMPVLDFTNATPGSPGDFAFISDRNGEALELYIMSLDGTNIQLLPSTELNKIGVANSYAMDRFVFIDSVDVIASGNIIKNAGKERQASNHLYSLNRSDGSMNMLLEDDELWFTNISGDGQKVAYNIYMPDDDFYFVDGINYDGTGDHHIMGDIENEAMFPCVSNDGTKVAYSLWYTGFAQNGTKEPMDDGIYTDDWAGGNSSLVVPDTESQGSIYPAFSPDGTKLAFVTMDDDLEVDIIRVLDLVQGGDPVEIYQTEEFIGGLRYTADGSKLLFSRYVSDGPVPVARQKFMNKKDLREALRNSRGMANVKDRDEGVHVFSVVAEPDGEVVQLTTGDGTWNFFDAYMFF